MAHSRAKRNTMIDMHKKPKHSIQAAANQATKGSLHQTLGLSKNKDMIPLANLAKTTRDFKSKK
jgi:hypothetical protein